MSLEVNLSIHQATVYGASTFQLKTNFEQANHFSWFTCVLCSNPNLFLRISLWMHVFIGCASTGCVFFKFLIMSLQHHLFLIWFLLRCFQFSLTCPSLAVAHKHVRFMKLR